VLCLERLGGTQSFLCKSDHQSWRSWARLAEVHEELVTEVIILQCGHSRRFARMTALQDEVDLRCQCAKIRFGEPFNKRSTVAQNLN
jgi:hypothetical protein